MEARTVRRWRNPVGIWLVLLVVVFASEYAVMLFLPWVLDEGASRALEATVDAVVLTFLLAPALWWTIVRPLTEVIRLRTQFLSDLFEHIEVDRRQIAHELHDGVGQSLTLLISGLRSAKTAGSDVDISRRLQDFQRLAEDALTDVRRLSRGLRPSLLDDLGLAPALERLVEDVRVHSTIEVTLDTAAIAERRISDEVATAVFRIVQEALSNIIKHSQAKLATIRVRLANDQVHVEVTDDGCGMAPAILNAPPAGHLGLRGMRERASLIGGRFSVDSSPGRGTRIDVALPIQGVAGG